MALAGGAAVLMLRAVRLGLLPGTPLGGYNPDWAVLIQHDGEDRLYFVVETKSTALLVDDARRGTENAKIQCGKEHFATVAAGNSPPAEFIVAKSVDDMINRSLKGRQ